MSQHSPYRLHDAPGYQLTVTARVLERRFEADLRTLGLTRITWCVLLAAGHEGLSQPSEIADFIGIDRTATSRALRQLETAGLIRRDTARRDRRQTRVALTGEGSARLGAALPLAEASRARILAALAPGEAAQLLRLLAKLRAGESAPLKGL